MKKIIKLSAVVLLAVMVVASCSKESQLKKRVTGTWNLDKVDVVATPTGGGSAQTFSFPQAGTMTFKSDGTGSGTTVILGQTTNNTFNWTNTATTVTVTESGKTPSIYTVTKNEKTSQVWTSTETDATGTYVYTYTMSKK